MDIADFSLKVKEHSLTLRICARRFTNDNEEAKDLLQDTILRAFMSRTGFNSSGDIGGLLYTIMKNIFINNLRKLCRTERLLTDSGSLNSESLLSSASWNLSDRIFMQEDIANAIDRLPKIYAEPFIAQFEGYKYEEISQQLEIPIGTVKRRIHQARKQLQNALRNYHFQHADGLVK